MKLKQQHTRTKCDTKKVYICVFICHSSGAVHLEILRDKTTESFLLSIKRMANRRGMPNIIMSDNAAEIIRAKNYIKDLYQKLNTSKTDLEHCLYILQNPCVLPSKNRLIQNAGCCNSVLRLYRRTFWWIFTIFKNFLFLGRLNWDSKKLFGTILY